MLYQVMLYKYPLLRETEMQKLTKVMILYTCILWILYFYVIEIFQIESSHHDPINDYVHHVSRIKCYYLPLFE